MVCSLRFDQLGNTEKGRDFSLSDAAMRVERGEERSNEVNEVSGGLAAAEMV